MTAKSLFKFSIWFAIGLGVLFMVAVLMLRTGNDIFARPILGMGSVHFSSEKVVVRIDGKPWKQGLVFPSGGEKSSTKVLYVFDKDKYQGRQVFLFSLNDKMMYLPNSNKRDYRLMFGGVLFQSASGYSGVPLLGDKTQKKLSEFRLLDHGDVSFRLSVAPKQKYYKHDENLPLGVWEIIKLKQ